MDKHARYRKKNMAAGLCPCCGKLPAPGFKQCAARIKYKRIHAYMREMEDKGLVARSKDGWYLTETGLIARDCEKRIEDTRRLEAAAKMPPRRIVRLGK